MKINVYKDFDQMSLAAARFFVEEAALGIARDDRFAVALSGGNTPRRMQEYLTRPEITRNLPWEKVYVFWGDERCVPLDDERNNAHNALEQFLEKVPIPHNNIFRIETDKEPEEAAELYEQRLKQFFGDSPPRFDLIFLGLGENGHTASLFPGTSIANEKERWVSEVYLKEQEMTRISLTPAVINKASKIAFLVSGAKKAEIVQEVLEQEYNPEKLPAQLIKPDKGEVYWFLDNEAAKNLANAEIIGEVQ
jgi:6-phosphogluconolactonase